MSVWYWLYYVIVGGMESILVGKEILGLEWRKGWKKYVVFLVAFLAGVYCFFSGMEGSTFSLLSTLFIIGIFFKEKVLVLLKNFFIAFCFLTLMDSFVWSVSLLFTSDTVTKTGDTYNLICGMVGFVIWFILCIVKCKKKILDSAFFYNMSKLQSGLFIIGLLAMNLLLACMQGFLYEEMTIKLKKVAIFFCIVTIFYMIFVFSILLKNYQKNKFLEEIFRLDKQCVDMQQQYYLKSIEKYEELRSYRHDVRNHMQIIQSLCEQQRFEEVMQYARRLDNDYAATVVGYTGNVIVDCLLSEMLDELESKDLLDFKVLGKLPEILPMENVDSCILFSNAFRNACEALQGQKQNPRFFMKIKRGRQEIEIVIQNSVEEHDIDLSVSSKGDGEKHGYGIRNMKKVVEKYHGSITWKIVGNLVQVEIFLPVEEMNS